MNPGKKLRGVCVGAGYFSRFQYEAWSRIDDVEIVANANRNPEKAAQIAKEFGIPKSYSYEEFSRMLDIEKPDFVDIITPPETHLELCRAAAERNISIICQKPLAPEIEETTRIVSLASQHPIRFMVHENWRWQPWYREIKSIIDSGVLGNLFHLTFQCRLGDGWGDDAYLARQPFFRDYPRLFLFETGVHFLDTFRYLIGEPENIYARTSRRNPVIKGEDSALVVCGFKDGVTAVLDANRYNECDADNPRFTFGTLRLDGSQGHLELDFDGTIRIKPLGEDFQIHPYQPSTGGFAGDCVFNIQKHFVECIHSGNPFESETRDYLKSVLLVEAAYQSARSGSVINLLQPTEKL